MLLISQESGVGLPIRTVKTLGRAQQALRRGLLAKAELRRVRFHDLRHSYASLLLQNGESPAYVKEQMGHSSIQVTVDIYGHLIPGANRQAGDRLDDAVPRNALRFEVDLI